MDNNIISQDQYIIECLARENMQLKIENCKLQYNIQLQKQLQKDKKED